MQKQTDNNKRIVQLDYIRVLAIVLVVGVHTDSLFLNSWRIPYLSAYALGELGVPLFVMLTGFLLVHRDFSGSYMKRFVTRNLLPLLVAYEIWNLLWWIGVRIFPAATRFIPERSLFQAFKAAFLIDDTGNALWFLPMMIGLYLGLPIVASLVRYFSREALRIYGGILVAAAIYFGVFVPTLGRVMIALGHPIPMHSVLNLNIFGASVWGESVWIVYLLCGYALRHEMLKRFSSLLLIAIGLVSFVAEVALKWALQERGDGVHVEYSSFAVVVCALILFELFRRIPARPEGGNLLSRTASWLSLTSFGIYMLHAWMATALLALLHHIAPSFVTEQLPLSFGVAVLSYIMFVVVCTLLSGTIVWLLSRILRLGQWLFLMK